MQTKSMRGAKPSFKTDDNPRLSMEYDSSTGTYHYYFPNGSGFSSNCPLGSISNSSVEIHTENDAFIERCSRENILYEMPETAEKDEKLLEFNSDSTGGYDFLIESITNDGVNWEIYSSCMTVSLINRENAVRMSLLRPPCGYEIGEVLLNGENMAAGRKDLIYLERDGDYTVTFSPVEMKGADDYLVSFKRDTTAPGLIFSKDITAGEIEGTVSFRPTEENERISVYLNGSLISETPDAVAAGGDYRIEASDIYGNSRDYYFKLKGQSAFSPALYIGIAAALILSAVIVFLCSKRSLRVL